MKGDVLMSAAVLWIMFVKDGRFHRMNYIWFITFYPEKFKTKLKFLVSLSIIIWSTNDVLIKCLLHPLRQGIASCKKIWSYIINSYKPSIIFVGHRQTVQNQIWSGSPLFAYRSFI